MLTSRSTPNFAPFFSAVNSESNVSFDVRHFYQYIPSQILTYILINHGSVGTPMCLVMHGTMLFYLFMGFGAIYHLEIPCLSMFVSLVVFSKTEKNLSPMERGPECCCSSILPQPFLHTHPPPPSLSILLQGFPPFPYSSVGFFSCLSFSFSSLIFLALSPSLFSLSIFPLYFPSLWTYEPIYLYLYIYMLCNY